MGLGAPSLAGVRAAPLAAPAVGGLAVRRASLLPSLVPVPPHRALTPPPHGRRAAALLEASLSRLCPHPRPATSSFPSFLRAPTTLPLSSHDRAARLPPCSWCIVIFSARYYRPAPSQHPYLSRLVFLVRSSRYLVVRGVFFLSGPPTSRSQRVSSTCLAMSAAAAPPLLPRGNGGGPGRDPPGPPRKPIRAVGDVIVIDDSSDEDAAPPQQVRYPCRQCIHGARFNGNIECKPRQRGETCMRCAAGHKTCERLQAEYATSALLRRCYKNLLATTEGRRHVLVERRAKQGDRPGAAPVFHRDFLDALDNWGRAASAAKAQVTASRAQLNPAGAGEGAIQQVVTAASTPGSGRHGAVQQHQELIGTLAYGFTQMERRAERRHQDMMAGLTGLIRSITVQRPAPALAPPPYNGRGNDGRRRQVVRRRRRNGNDTRSLSPGFRAREEARRRENERHSRYGV